MSMLAATAFVSALLLTAAAAPAPYSRDAWPHWARSPATPCRTVRVEVLARDAAAATLSEDGCRVVAGSWVDPYDGRVITAARRVDVDHVVPLAWAHRHGGDAWDTARRGAFANDLTYSRHLLATSAATNRAKGARGPSAWAPPSPEARCQYGEAWATILVTWDLRPDPRDRDAIRALVASCGPWAAEQGGAR